jgi:predicted nucleic acid-binding protein
MADARVLIDTSLLIDHLRRVQKERTAFYLAAGRYECVVSAITEFEFRAGSTAINQPFVNALLDLTPVLPFDSACVGAAVAIYRDLRARNQLIALPDLLIAATAVAHQLPLLTLNLSHFERITSLKLLDLTGL